MTDERIKELRAQGRHSYPFCQGDANECLDEIEFLKGEYEKASIFFEQFGDLSGCYDAEDMVRLGQGEINEKERKFVMMKDSLKWYTGIESIAKLQKYLNNDKLGDLARETLKALDD